MEIIKLQSEGSDPSYLQEALIEGWTSMIWTRRFVTPGDFELHTPLINETFAALPAGSLISLRDEVEVMEVESHKVAPAGEGGWELVVKGRSVDLHTENRYVEAPYGKRRQMCRQYPADNAIAVLLWNAFVNPTNNDVTWSGDRKNEPMNKIPNFAINVESLNPLDTRKIWLKNSELKAVVEELLNSAGLGLKTRRPPQTTAGSVDVVTSGSLKGAFKRYNPFEEPIDTRNHLMLTVYAGTDRSHLAAGDIWEPVVFHIATGVVEDPSYFYDQSIFKSHARVISSEGYKHVYRKSGVESGYIGRDRRSILVDAGSPDDGENKSEFKDSQIDAGRDELAAHKFIALFDGKIAPRTLTDDKMPVFEQDYYLGDLVTLTGTLQGSKEVKRVSEYIRVQDLQGERGYPTLATPSGDS